MNAHNADCNAPMSARWMCMRVNSSSGVMGAPFSGFWCVKYPLSVACGARLTGTAQAATQSVAQGVANA